MNDKSKDTAKARQDLQMLHIRSGLWLDQTKNGKCLKPQAAYSFTPENRKKFCQYIKGVKLPDGFGSCFKHKVTDNDTNITGLKSHDCHIMMQRLLPYGLQNYLPDKIAKPIIELCSLFKQICSATLMEDDMLKAQIKVVDILCELELIYPPALFDIMVHLVIHLPLEALEGGPIRPRWMYPFERYMKKLKGYVRNKAKPEGSIAEGYVAEEALTFSSHYFRDVTTKFNRPDRNVDPPPPTCRFQVFRSVCKPIGLRSFIRFDAQELKKVKCLFPNKDMQEEFPDWFGSQIRQRHVDNDQDPEVSTTSELFALANGPSWTPISVNSCVVDGVSLSDLDNATLHIDYNYGGRRNHHISIDVPDEDDDIIDDEDALPHDLAILDVEDLINVDDDGVEKMSSADVARSYGGDGGGEDRPPLPHGSGQAKYPRQDPEPKLKEIAEAKGPVSIHFDVGDKQTLNPLGPHAAHWSNYIREVIRSVPLYYPSWEKVPKERKATLISNIGARPKEITADEWDNYIRFWNDPKNLARAAQNRQNQQKSVVISRQGSRSLARLRDEMRQASDTQEYPSLIDTFWRTHSVDGEEIKRLEATGEYTEDEINALARGGKLRGHIPGVGRVLPSRATSRPSMPAPDKSLKSIHKKVDFMMSLFRSDSKYSDMFKEFESGCTSGSGGCGDDEESGDDEEGEDEDGDGER
ncbi:hypothetical protein Tco_0809011 [Tanacetum coccineum]